MKPSTILGAAAAVFLSSTFESVQAVVPCDGRRDGSWCNGVCTEMTINAKSVINAPNTNCIRNKGGLNAEVCDQPNGGGVCTKLSQLGPRVQIYNGDEWWVWDAPNTKSIRRF